MSVLPVPAPECLGDQAAHDAPDTHDLAGSLVRWGCGLHPWWVADGRAGEGEVEALLAAIAANPFVGEIGLDFGKSHGGGEDGMARQIRAFRRVAEACARIGGRVLSIHAVASAPEAGRILRETGALESCTCIFHWYSGDGETFHAAVKAGCFFSVGSFMLESRRGREYARQVPEGQLLLETDYPPQGEAYDVGAMQRQLAQTCERIASLRGAPAAALAHRIEQNSRAVLGR